MTGIAIPHAVAAAAALLWVLGGCAESPGPAPSPSTAAENSILAGSNPAAGSTVAAPVDELVLHFDPPARLGEVTITGSDGVMPMMITSVGEVPHYSVPLSGLGPGDYTVRWSATSGGQAHEGSFSFTVQ